MYYGNLNAPDASNGSETFILFDDFSSDTDDNWVETVSGDEDYYNRDLGISLDAARLRTKIKINDINARNWASPQNLDIGLTNNTGAG